MDHFNVFKTIIVTLWGNERLTAEEPDRRVNDSFLFLTLSLCSSHVKTWEQKTQTNERPNQSRG